MSQSHKPTGSSPSHEALARQLSARWRQELAALRAKLDTQLRSAETQFDQHLATMEDLAAESLRAELESAMVINASLRSNLLDMQQRLEAACVLAETRAVQLRAAEQQTEALAADCAALRLQLRDATGVGKKIEPALETPARRQQVRKPTAPSEIVQAEAAAIAQTFMHASSARKKPLTFSEPARDPKRVKIQRGVQIIVDGIPGELVDMSVGGAQVILRQAAAVDQLIRLTVPSAGGELICKGRIVWSAYEQPPTSLAVFRTGIKFTDVDSSMVERFMADFCDKPIVNHSRRSSEIA